MQAVDVLGGIDKAGHRIRVDVRGQGQLEQDAVHTLVLVQVAQQVGQLLLGDLPGWLVVDRLDPHLGAGLALAAHVDRRRRVVSHEHRCQPRCDPPRFPKLRDLGGHALAHPGRDRLAVDHPRAHLIRGYPLSRRATASSVRRT
jgi:hypothetical protein